ncbi:MAG: 4-hydroxy-2-oxoheptanedioate aldolase [Thermoleophilaceae bacterium]|nr:4-hydroxy-2-oxoheptanedioate aldolase [Thermoleophilaceae bacterium]
MDPQSPIRFADRLLGRETLAGTVLTVPSVALAELVAETVDFVWIDLEHGALDTADVQPLAVAARAAGCAAFVRLASCDWSRVPAILDAGVDGVVAPRVESAVQARRLVDALRHPPRGSRGFAARRATGYGRMASTRDPLCLAQVESAAGVQAAGEIAAVEGIDALVVGCADLGLALDGTPEPTSSAVRDAIAQVQAAAEEHGIASGIAGPDDPQVLRELAGAVSTLLVCSADVRIYARAVDETVAGLRAPVREGSGVGA